MSHYFEITPELRRGLEEYEREHATEIAASRAEAIEREYQYHLHHCHTNATWMLERLRPLPGDSDEILVQKEEWMKEFVKATLLYAGELKEELHERRQPVEA